MNIWKPISVWLAAGLVASFGIQTASANKNPDPQPRVTGPCFDQLNMARAKASLEDAIGSLNHAEHNKNGWRDRALAAAKKARDEVAGGCAIADTK